MLATYKVGHQQFFVTWVALVACLPLLNRPDADRLAHLSLPYATFLSLFQLGFVLLQPQYYRGPWAPITSFVGILSFALELWLLVPFLGKSSDVIPAKAGIQKPQTPTANVAPGFPPSGE